MVHLYGHAHQGTGRALQSVGKIYDAVVARPPHFKMQNHILKTLDESNETLVDVVREFSSVTNVPSSKVQIFCFFETRETVVRKIVGDKSIEEFVVNEQSGSLHGHEHQGLPLDHFDLNKFKGPDDDNYIAVSEEVERMTEAIALASDSSQMHIENKNGRVTDPTMTDPRVDKRTKDLQTDPRQDKERIENTNGGLLADRAREKWVFAGFDALSREELLQHLCGRPRFLSSDRHGWLIYTLTKLHILALTEDNPKTPSWEELERFYHNPTYVMRKREEKISFLFGKPDERFSASFQTRYGKRKLFFTEKGYLGLGPASAKVGDVIAILAGAKGPFVLRHGHPERNNGVATEKKDEKVLSVVGQAYAHGIMNGEVVEMDGFELQNLELA